MATLIAIVSLLCSILTIILFFKIWSACNDIKSINNKLNKQRKSTKFIIAGETEKGIEALKLEYVEKLIAQYYWYDGIKNVMNEYLPAFERLGVDLPEHLKNEEKLTEYVKTMIGKI